MEEVGLNLVRGGEGWAVEEREGRGRCLVASRQLEVSQLVQSAITVLAIWLLADSLV